MVAAKARLDFSAAALVLRREALLARIHAKREETAATSRRLAADFRAAEKARRSIHAGLRVLKASLVAAGVIWSFNAASNIGRGRRLLTISISLLSTVRAMRKVGAVLAPLITEPERDR